MNTYTCVFEKYPQLIGIQWSVFKVDNMLKTAYKHNKIIYFCGNGGSASDCEHMVGELMKSFRLPRPLSQEEQTSLTQYGEIGKNLANHLQQALPAVSLVSPTALNSAISNDMGSEYVYAQQVYGYGKPGDILVCFSTSGNSKNILYAATAARARGMKVIGFSGKTGGKLKALCDVCICCPSDSTEEIQEYHLPIYHALCRSLEEHFWGTQEERL